MFSEHTHPFTEPSADIIFCSSDDVQFRLHKIILSLASGFFKDMLSLPQPGSPSFPIPFQRNQPQSDDIDGLPVVHVTECSAVLESLFRLCYPIDDPPLTDLAQVYPVLEAAIKYQMDEATKIAKSKLLEIARLGASVRVYATACRLSLEDLAAAAAGEVLLQQAQHDYAQELEEIPVGAYHRLLYFCELGGKVAGDFVFHHHPALDRAPIPESSHDSSTRAPRSLAERPDHSDSTSDASNCEMTNVTISASDGVQLHVVKAIVQLSSPVLAAMLSSLPPSEYPCLTLSEPSHIISVLFQICSPADEDPPLADLHDIFSAFVAAEKYKMKKPITFLRGLLAKQTTDPSVEPLTLYLVTCSLNLRDLASAAARRTLRRSLTTELNAHIDSFGAVAGTLWRLLEYHRECRKIVGAMTSDKTWIPPKWRISKTLLHYGPTGTRSNLPCWVHPYLARLKQAEWPSPEFAMESTLLRSILYASGSVSQDDPLIVKCDKCTDSIGVMTLVDFSKYVGHTLAARENEIVLQWKSPTPSDSTLSQ